MNFKRILLASAIVLPGVASADFLNGSFELPSLTNGTQQSETGTQMPDWTVTGGTAYIITNEFVGDAVTWNPTPDGNQFLYLNADVQGNVVLSQTVALNAGSNTLNFLQADFGTQFGSPGGEVNVSVLDASNNVVVAPTLFTTPDFSPFFAQSLTFNVASAGDYTFDFTSVANHAAILDGVSVMPAPEPASMLALAAGSALVLRRKKARSK